MIVGEMEPTTIASCATQYLQLLLEETKDSDAIQQTARQVLFLFYYLPTMYFWQQTIQFLFFSFSHSRYLN